MATFRTYPHTQTGSQESLGSYSSGTALVASSNASQATADTGFTSPTSPRFAQPTHDDMLNASSQQTHATDQAQRLPGQDKHRVKTPENQTDASRAHGAQQSPMSITTPVNGHKRMASGEVKSMGANSYTSPAYASRAGMARAGSVGSAGSKASEVAGTLKERLTYAMTKVQHGWEHHNIDQVERIAAAAAISPRTAISPRDYRRGVHASPRSAGFPSRILTDQMPHHQTPYHDQQTKSAPLARPYVERASSDESMSPPAKRRPTHDSAVSPSGIQHFHSLAPAPELVAPTSPYRRHARKPSNPQPSISSSPTQRVPTTPKGPRPATLRTQTQTAAAEQEAMDALLLMGSPSNGAFPRGSQQSSAAQSPHRRTFAPVAPRQALQYRSDSSHDSVTSESSTGFGKAIGGREEMLRLRGEMLERIEAEA
ncbi:hypothetical protein CAC42_3398 [Sphaceloma murrayae]|uniref:Uncharacterized protein n=1 Tax=Sphaceloma murrayae TaxID=2082308 RepID=A0A2K1R195_9PEZI|nr:hypothetical protein CAC42_3398 [Sphaceloma murrayae]